MKKLAVLLPTFNAAPYIKESIDSILNQTFADFDLYVYDDCSTDATASIIAEYTDVRLYYRKNVENLGISKTLNRGLDELLPHYEYIARMDADDWSYPERFQKQLDYLEQHPATVLCGTQGYWLKDISQEPSSAWKYPVSHEYIKHYLLFGATFNHQSIMFRANFLLENNLRYDEKITTCEDWEFWTRIVKLGSIVNLPEFLIKCRILPYSNHHSPLNKVRHFQERSNIISNYWSFFDVNLSPTQIFDFYYSEEKLSKEEFLKNCTILIQSFNKVKRQTDLVSEEKKIFSYLLARKLLNYWKRSQVSRSNPVIWWTIIREVRFVNKLKLIKSIIR
ncbi:glycosyltransferase family 2 protein [Flavobacterium faecale]|uniref:glycosyltransferase family 2 protein n=1 Tax=Flavobacterium faecale TaxID=1355330 RepID=UPI003AADA1D0